MNGRLYDPVIRRFLSPDNFVQDPYNTQNFDRYTYVYNNPLMFTDPSGEYGWDVLIAFAIVAMYQVGTNLSNDLPWFQGLGKTAIASAVSYGIGTATTAIFGQAVTMGSVAFQAGAHAVTAGVMSSLDGENFMSGFAAGAVSSLISSGVQTMGEASTIMSFYGRSGFSDGTVMAMTIAAGGLSGGISSSIAGGKFVDGARQGLITSGMNSIGSSAFRKNLTRKSAASSSGTRSENYTEDPQGDIISLHTEGDEFDIWAKEKSISQEGVVQLHSHGSETTINMMKSAKDIGDLLYYHSPTWRDMADNGRVIELHIYACSTANGIAADISKMYPNVIVKAPTTYWMVQYIYNKTTFEIISVNKGYVEPPGRWMYFRWGTEISKPNRFPLQRY